MRSSVRLPERFNVLGRLGEGATGSVWLAEDTLRDGVRLAIKTLAPDRRIEPDVLRREFAMLRQLRNVHLVEVYDFEAAPETGTPYLTMEWIDGLPIVEALRGAGSKAFLESAAEALGALAFLHDFGIAHRDLKPANLLMRKRPRLGTRLVVLDFGLSTRGPETRTAAGTLPYIAPELFEGARPGPRSDLYALGAVLFEVLHGRPPFEPGESQLASFIERVRTGTRRRPAVPRGYPADLGGWLDRMLSVDPAHRPATATDALARLGTATGVRFPSHPVEDRAARLASGPPPGRRREIEALEGFLSPSDRPRVILLYGRPGSGRRRILRWLAADQAGRGADVVTSPPELGPSVPEPGDGDPLERLLGDLRRRADRGPTVVLLHPFDTAASRGVGFLERIAREGKSAPLRVVAALGPEDLATPALRRLLEQADQVPTLRRVDLPPLDTESMTQLVARATGSRSPSNSRVRWLEKASGGDALVAESLLVQGAWERGKAATAAAAAPIDTRLAWLPDAPHRLLEALAVIEDRVPGTLAANLADLDVDAARDALSQLHAVGAAHATGNLWSVESSALARGLVAALDPAARIELYRRAAFLLEPYARSSSGDVFPVARMWSGAGEARRVISVAIEAAEWAEERGDAMRAADRYAFALRHVQRRDRRRLSIRLRHAAALRAANRPRAAVRAFGGALRLARGGAMTARILADQAAMLVQAGRFERAHDVASRALEVARSIGDNAVQARAMEALGTLLARRGKINEALPFLREAVAEFDRAGETLSRAHALQALGLAEVNAGRAEARSHLEAAIELYRDSEPPGRGLINRVGLAVLEQRAGRYDLARDLLRETRALAGRYHNLLIEAVACGTLAQNCVFENRLSEAIELASEAEQQALHLGDERLIFAARSARCQALTRCGRSAEAVTILETTLETPLERIDPVVVETVRLALVEAYLGDETTEADRIGELLRAAIGRTQQLRDPDSLLWALVLRVELSARPGSPGSPDEAESARAELERLSSRGESWSQPYFEVRAGIAMASAALAAGHHEQAVRFAREAELAAREPGLAGLGAAALAVAGQALEGLDRATDATAEFQRGDAWLEQASRRIDDPGLRLGFLESPAYGPLRRARGRKASRVNRRLLALYGMIRALNSENDPEQLLHSILDMALRAVGAERGMILLRENDGAFHVRVARKLDGEKLKDRPGFSSRVVSEAALGNTVISVDATEDPRFRDADGSSLHGVRSLICAPLSSRGKVIGAVYVDSSSGKRLFHSDDGGFLEAFANHAALALENVQDRARLEAENAMLQEVVESRVKFGNLVGHSPAMLEVFDLIGKLAESDLPVLIQGESGTGKELVARAIHFNGPRRKAPFVTENCAVIPDALLQSELFGHTKGAFTGADRNRTGLFELADGGTLFLDEVGDMSRTMQAQLLRVIQEREVRPLGGDRSTRIDVRILTATHRKLEDEVAAGRFREDLFYRLRVLTIDLPPLRDRPGDLPRLVDHFLRRIAESRNRPVPRITADVMEWIELYAWPGNVRQLENTLQRLSLLAGDEPIGRQVVEADPGLRQILGTSGTEALPAMSLQQSERDRIVEALAAAGGNRTRAARLLGISRATIYRKIREFSLRA